MKNPDPTQPDPSVSADPAPFDAFKALAAKIIKVPKAEIDRREAEYQHEQAKKAKRGPKPGPKHN